MGSRWIFTYFHVNVLSLYIVIKCVCHKVLVAPQKLLMAHVGDYITGLFTQFSLFSNDYSAWQTGNPQTRE